MPDPTIGRIVTYRAKAGWLAPAVIAATLDTLDPDGVQRWRDSGGADGGAHWEGIPPLASPDHVHLVVFSAGRQAGEPPLPLDRNQGGTFREWNVPLWTPGEGVSMAQLARPQAGGPPMREEQPVGSWRWPERR